MKTIILEIAYDERHPSLRGIHTDFAVELKKRLESGVLKDLGLSKAARIGHIEVIDVPEGLPLPS